MMRPLPPGRTGADRWRGDGPTNAGVKTDADGRTTTLATQLVGRRGHSTLEYALLLALVVVTVWVSYQALGAGTGRSVSGADERMTTAMNAPSSPCDTGGGAPAPPAGD